MEEHIDLHLNKVKWNYGAYQIGVGSYLLVGKPLDYVIKVRISQKDRAGNLKYPGTYCLTVGQILKYDTEMVGQKRNVKVYLVPIGSWTVTNIPEQVVVKKTKPDKRTKKRCDYPDCDMFVPKAEWESHEQLHKDQVSLFDNLDI